jgi:ribose transport system ATP-binding protein
MGGISKRYPGVIALDSVSFSVGRGEVHCLLGENGAGKSTLMKILCGAIEKDNGTITIDDSPVSINSPLDAQRLGIGSVYQDFKLVPELSAAENIFLGHEPLQWATAFIDFEEMHRRSRALIQQLGEEIDTHERVAHLSTAQRQIVEIAKALSRNLRLLILDEPTASLSERETQNLFRVLRRLKSDGLSVVYISHRLEEVFEVGDRITVLRDGKHIVTCATSEADRAKLIRWMVGRELEQEFPSTQLTRGEELLRVEGLSGEAVHDVSFTLHRGEILGFAGLVGAGRTELARLLFGADETVSGAIVLCGKQIHPRSPQEAIAHGIGLLTEDRNTQGLFLHLNVRENISASSYKILANRFGFVDSENEQRVAKQVVGKLRIKTPSVEMNVASLSGGNRQKVVLARWLTTHCRVLIFDEPTVGIDVGVKYEIYELIQKLAADGIGIVVISSDLQEILGIATRIVVMCEGRISGILERDEATQEKILHLATQIDAEIAQRA